MIRAGYFLFDIIFLALGSRHSKFSFIPLALGAGFLAKNQFDDGHMLIAAYFVLVIAVCIYGFINWEYLGTAINKMDKQDFVLFSFLLGAMIISSIGMMLYYEESNPVLNGAFFGVAFIIDLLLAKGVHDGWLLMAITAVLTAVVAFLLGEWVIVSTSILVALGAFYVFAQWSVDYYGSIRYQIIE